MVSGAVPLPLPPQLVSSPRATAPANIRMTINRGMGPPVGPSCCTAPMQRRAIHTRGFFKHEAKPRAAGSESFHSKSVRVLRGRFGNHNRLKAAGAANSTRAHVAGEQGVCTKTSCEGEPEGSAPQIWRRERPLRGSHFGRAIGWSWPYPAVGLNWRC